MISSVLSDRLSGFWSRYYRFQIASMAHLNMITFGSVWEQFYPVSDWLNRFRIDSIGFGSIQSDFRSILFVSVQFYHFRTIQSNNHVGARRVDARRLLPHSSIKQSRRSVISYCISTTRRAPPSVAAITIAILFGLTPDAGRSAATVSVQSVSFDSNSMILIDSIGFRSILLWYRFRIEYFVKSKCKCWLQLQDPHLRMHPHCILPASSPLAAVTWQTCHQSSSSSASSLLPPQ